MTGTGTGTGTDAPDGGDGLYSVRMRASDGGAHVSGAETLTGDPDAAAGEMVARALDHPRGDPDEVTVTVEPLDCDPVRTPALPVVTVEAAGVDAARATVARLLRAAGVDDRALAAGRAVLEGDTAARGAALLDADDGARLDPDPERGVRATRMGATADADLDAAVARARLADTRVRDALVLATKVEAAPGVLAEVCRSDNPDYDAGYCVAGGVYYRFPRLSEASDDRGGRAVFLAPDADLEECARFLSAEPLLVTGARGFERRPPEAVPVANADPTGRQSPR
jgi:6-carboxyhexanoate--CoA ligase